MPPLKPVKRKELIRFLRMTGFEGPFSGGKHQFLLKDQLRLALPNPHQTDIGINLLSRILRQAGISKKDWKQL